MNFHTDLQHHGDISAALYDPVPSKCIFPPNHIFLLIKENYFENLSSNKREHCG